MKGGLGDLMRQAQKMQEQYQQTQRELEQLEVIGEAGAGMVKVTMTGKHDVRRVNIDPNIDVNDREMLEDLVAAAMNDAVRKVEKLSKEKMADMAAGMPLPPGMKLPF